HRKYLDNMQSGLKGIKGAQNKLRKLIWEHINVYDTERVYARIILIEARSHPSYFDSSTYFIVKEYTHLFKDIVEEGIKNGEINENISAWTIKQVILGAIEHVCLPNIIFDREFSVDDFTENICDIIFAGIRKKD
ncbi:MAG: TetR/AcrR family transcriptional regulator, partial [Deltaproteobacteria bacterium]|nr:TetR/AcrR family transcriptional regulator [Deltaproteobacteria bacterium]